MTDIPSHLTLTLSREQASAIHAVMVDEFKYHSRALVHVLERDNADAAEVVAWTTKLLDLQEAFDAFSKSKVFVSCASQNISQWRLKLRKNKGNQTRLALNNLRGLLRVAVDIPELKAADMNSVTLSIGHRTTIKQALNSQWGFNVTRFSLMIRTINVNIAIWKEKAAENDIWMRDQLKMLLKCRIAYSSVVGGVPVLPVPEGELEHWLLTVDKAVTDPVLRILNMNSLTEFLRDMPVCVHQNNGGPRPKISANNVQRVRNIAWRDNSKGIRQWSIYLASVPPAEVNDVEDT